MVRVTEEQLDFINQYHLLLNCVEDGLELVDISYQERNFGSGDTLLTDIIGSLIPFQASNLTLKSILMDDRKLIHQIDLFQLIIEQANHISDILHITEEKARFIHEFMLPAYKQWKIKTEIMLRSYVIN